MRIQNAPVDLQQALRDFNTAFGLTPGNITMQEVPAAPSAEVPELVDVLRIAAGNVQRINDTNRRKEDAHAEVERACSRYRGMVRGLGDVLLEAHALASGE